MIYQSRCKYCTCYLLQFQATSLRFTIKSKERMEHVGWHMVAISVYFVTHTDTRKRDAREEVPSLVAQEGVVPTRLRCQCGGLRRLKTRLRQEIVYCIKLPCTDTYGNNPHLPLDGLHQAIASNLFSLVPVHILMQICMAMTCTHASSSAQSQLEF